MLEALVGGERDPVVLAELARGVLRKKRPLLRQALKGRFSDHHGLLVGLSLAHLEHLEHLERHQPTRPARGPGDRRVRCGA
jgi:transposase